MRAAAWPVTRRALAATTARPRHRHSKTATTCIRYGLLALLALLTGCKDGLSHSRTVCVSGYNEYEKQIHEFWLDNESKSGCFGNPPGRSDGDPWGGGAKFACGCKVTPGKSVTLQWSFVQSVEDFDAGKKAQEFALKVTIPQPESRSSRYLRVYFRKNGTASLQWVDDMGVDELPPTPDKQAPESPAQPAPALTVQHAPRPRPGAAP
ncbi:DUF3304 domain-containing protein [Xanthomonas maliensis]|nr:DUF3304 domain-containing protein [Xanthomonas maliensis]